MTRKWFEYGGWIAGAVLVVFGVIAIVMGVNERNEVQDAIAAQKITAGDDAAEITTASFSPARRLRPELSESSSRRSWSTTLDATGGKRYAEMGAS